MLSWHVHALAAVFILCVILLDACLLLYLWLYQNVFDRCLDDVQVFLVLHFRHSVSSAVCLCVCLCTWQTFLSGRQTGSGIDRFKVMCPAGTGYFLSPEPFQVQVDKTRFSRSHQKGFKRLQSPFLGTSDGPSKAGWGRGVHSNLSRDGQALLQKQVPRPDHP